MTPILLEVLGLVFVETARCSILMLKIITNTTQGNILSPSRRVCGPLAYLILGPSSAVVFVLCRLIYIKKLHVSIGMINILHSQKANESEEQLQEASTHEDRWMCAANMKKDDNDLSVLLVTCIYVLPTQLVIYLLYLTKSLLSK